MHKIFLISGLTLALAGCAAQQGENGPVQVRDLSAARADSRPAQYTVEAGDTLYGIAWRHDMDYRDLARLNRIGPPYRIEPGQTLALGGDRAGAAASGQAAEAGAAAGGGVVATGLGGESSGSGEDLDWLMPDESAIERNRRLSAEPSLADDDTTDGPANARGDDASGADQGPGPVYSYDSPGADGELSERDLAERRERDAASQDEVAEDDASETAAAESSQPVAEQPAQASSKDGGEATAAADEGASVAGEPASQASTERRYTPVEEVPWQWPAPGEVVGRFGEGSSITAGIDIAGQKGQSVKAAGPGIVVYAGSGVRGYGNLILLKHNDQYLSAYAHNQSLNVEENDVVEAGDVIATMGDSDAEDVRLHFEVRKDGQPQDPLEYLPTR
ncbi:peptidoglycan DD-metalloendopeptidase family protein [Halomonas saccharevitans]|uniref:Peptidoglycan DD-metalloendopeptidase family protein n=1 Tax=Halomonas saccharevitans TaxID=416872 RepID=A0ABU3NEW4_9GAMM|nr:peptidoglycan DD-metalloendopeptidase family protein [Halomonas saccharevitans]MDT8879702.1 peptidoglycan DD-metalloendopeptidase family protein [Halomonas saccharevitans]